MLSAKVDEDDKLVLHIWTFKPKIQKKGCCCKSIVRIRVLEVGATMG